MIEQTFNDVNAYRPWILLPSWMNIKEAQEWNNQIKDYLDWKQPLLRVYGSKYLAPRLTTFIAERNIRYCNRT